MTDDVVVAVSERFRAYEDALMANDLDRLREFFLPNAVRYGPDGNQYGVDEIDASRRVSTHPIQRELRNTSIRALSSDAAVAITEFVRAGSRRMGRQTQIWLRDDHTWRITHAHVSMLPDARQLS